MLPNEHCSPLDEIELLAKSFAKCLVEKGFQPMDLVRAANGLLDQALEMQKAKQAQPAPLKVIASKDRLGGKRPG